MCGIVGIATKQHNGFTNNEANLFEDLLYLDAFRGWDSTGVFGVDKHSNVQVHKEASQAANFIFTEEFKSFKQELFKKGLFAVGHNRAATRGVVNDKNAHPFAIDNKIVLVQNGTWRGDHTKIKDTEVDTEALAHIIAENDDVEEALSKIQAAYALCWFNTQNHTLNLVRNYERPLWFAETQSGSIVWASEGGFIQLAAMRNNITLNNKPELIDPHIHVKFEIKGHTWERTQTKVNPFRSFQQTPTNYCWPGIDEDDNFSTPLTPLQQQPSYHQQRLEESRRLIHAGRSSVPVVHTDRTLIDKQFSEVAYSLVTDPDCPDEKTASECQAQWRQWILDKRKCLVELEDYVSANPHKECTTWHVWGRAVVPEGDVVEHALIHWFIYNKTEKEIVDYVAQGFFEFEAAHTKKESFPGNTHIVTVMANPAKIIHVPTTETVVQ